MNCWRCGHSQKEHSTAHHNPNLKWCSLCERTAVNKKKNRFFLHSFENNLDYVIRKANERKLT